jgi:hypothetical protein
MKYPLQSETPHTLTIHLITTIVGSGEIGGETDIK